jgi:hypothetical protein
MSKPWTAITLNTITGKCTVHDFSASFDPAMAAEQFRTENPTTSLVALIPGMRGECQTYDIVRKPGLMSPRVDLFSLDGLADIG